MLHFSLSLMKRLNTPSLQFPFLYFGLVALEGSTFTRILKVMLHFCSAFGGVKRMHIINVIFHFQLIFSHGTLTLII